ncbi:hypothetical protein Btru_045151 [Bulinus truncatus]|nr:hypothetical protein Btru_045151 [Bulinus truncatus]
MLETFPETTLLLMGDIALHVNESIIDEIQRAGASIGGLMTQRFRALENPGFDLQRNQGKFGVILVVLFVDRNRGHKLGHVLVKLAVILLVRQLTQRRLTGTWSGAESSTTTSVTTSTSQTTSTTGISTGSTNTATTATSDTTVTTSTTTTTPNTGTTTTTPTTSTTTTTPNTASSNISSSTVTTSTTTTTPKIENFTLELRVDMNVSHVNFSDPNSEDYKYLKEICTESLKKIFNETSVRGLRNVTVTGLRNGSLIIDFTIEVNTASNTAVQSELGAVVLAVIKTGILIGNTTYPSKSETDACALYGPVCKISSQNCALDANGTPYCTTPKSSANDIRLLFGLVVGLPLFTSWWTFSY